MSQNKNAPVKLPFSIYIVLWAVVLSDAFVTFIMLKYFL